MNACAQKVRVRRMRHGLKHVAMESKRTWEHTRLEVDSELDALKKLLGPFCTMGVTKARPCKGNSCQVSLNEHDTVSIVEPTLNKPNFPEGM